MNEDRMAIIRLAVWILFAFAAIGYVVQYARSVDRTYPTRVFTVDGSGDIDTTPDVALFTATVVTEGSDVAKVQSANAEKMNKIGGFTKEHGVEAKDLKTTEYNLNPRYSNPPCTSGVSFRQTTESVAAACPPPIINGYTLTQSLEIKIRDTGKVSELLSGVVENGANRVSDVRFVVDDQSEAKNHAREEAMQKARDKARAMAQAGGFRIGKLVSLYESSGEPQPYYGGLGGDAMKSANVAPQVEPGTQTTQVQVTLTYEIVD